LTARFNRSRAPTVNSNMPHLAEGDKQVFS
jgi:hypothetical protein